MIEWTDGEVKVTRDFRCGVFAGGSGRANICIDANSIGGGGPEGVDFLVDRTITLVALEEDVGLRDVFNLHPVVLGLLLGE